MATVRTADGNPKVRTRGADGDRRGAARVRHNVSDKMDNFQQKWGDMAEALPGQGGGETFNHFPATYMSYDPEEERIKVKQEIHDASKGEGGIGNVDFEERDMRFFERKMKEFDERTFEHWFSNTLDFTNPHDLAFANQLVPEFFDRREEEIDNNIELVRRLAKINLRGLQTKEDMMLAYALYTGKVTAPSKDFWDPNGLVGGETVPGHGLRPGIFNNRLVPDRLNVPSGLGTLIFKPSNGMIDPGQKIRSLATGVPLFDKLVTQRQSLHQTDPGNPKSAIYGRNNLDTQIERRGVRGLPQPPIRIQPATPTLRNPIRW